MSVPSKDRFFVLVKNKDEINTYAPNQNCKVRGIRRNEEQRKWKICM